MSQGQRVKELRKELNLTLEKFGKPLGVGKTAISNIENDSRGLTDQMIISICREYNANEEWLRNGVGEMFREPSDEVGYYVADLLDYDGEGNAFYDAIIAMMKKYCQLDEKSKAIVKGFFEEITKEMKKEDD